MTPSRHRSRSHKRRRSRRKRGKYRRVARYLFVISTIVAGLYLAYLDFRVQSQFEGKRWALPARVYARPLEIYPQKNLSIDAFLAELKSLGYEKVKTATDLSGQGSLGYEKTISATEPGTYIRQGDEIRFVSRDFTFWDGHQASRHLYVNFQNNKIAELRESDSYEPVDLYRLSPQIIGRIYPQHNEDRILVQFQNVPPLFVNALVAVEDHNYYEHHGISFIAVARALLANIKAGAAVQGGSTLTQQLVKNFFLTPERTLTRKINEALMSVLLEFHYDKNEILEAYMNEIYLGQDGKRGIYGFGLASRFYFGRPLNELDLPKMALLVALVQGASYYNPRRHPERALKRRNLVLDVMLKEGVITAEQANKAGNSPLGVTGKGPSGITPYPAFLDLVRRQLQRDYQEEDLRTEGLQIFTTLDPVVQEKSEKALSLKLKQLENQYALPSDKLEGSVIVTGSNNGEVMAVVGGRDPRYAGFNRALDAVRQIGSLIKPAVYLTALSQPDKYTVMTMLDDSPIEFDNLDGTFWTPKNFDKTFHGQVPLHAALSHSYNVSTVRLGLTLGTDNVIRTLRRLGVVRDVTIYPSLLLGTVALTPLEVTQMYQTLAGGGFITPLRAIREVMTAQGTPLQRYPLRVEEVVSPAAVYLLNSVLQEAVKDGTGHALYEKLPHSLNIAGKTGTTDDLRDSWFAGFSGNYLSVVWLGMDDNSSTHLTGSMGAMRVWGALFSQLHAEPLQLAQPLDVESVWIDPATGLLGGEDCAGAVKLPFIKGSVPDRHAGCSGGGLKDVFDRVF